jgi:hypothetical protein
MDYGEVDGTEGTVYFSYTISGLQSDTSYYVWVVAEKGGLPGIFGTPVTGKTGSAPAAGKTGDKTIAGTSAKVKTAVYVEVNDHNPLNAGSYILEDGTYLFDYVILFAANIRNRDSATGSPYVHLNENVQYLLNNRTKYIVPLQQKGIKVLLGLLGDHDGVTFSSMNDAHIEAFVTDVKRVVDQYQLDGVDFDDEWGSKEDWDGWTNNYGTISSNSIWTYPTSTWGWPTSVTVYRDPSKGTGIDGIVAGNGTRTAPSAQDMSAMWAASGEAYYKTIIAARQKLGPDKLVSLYEYNTGRYITIDGVTNGSATRDGLLGAIDFALQPWYNQYHATSANALPNSIYSPFGMDLSGKAYSAQNGAPNPPIAVSGNEQASSTIYTYATTYKNTATSGNPYGMLYFYGLEPATNLLKYVSSDSKATVTKEEYMSIMSRIVFDQDVRLTAEGGDYRKDW